MNETTTTAAPETAPIRAELESIRTQYHALVGEIGEAHWKQRSAIPAWTCGQLAWHLSASIGFVAGQIEGAKKKGNGTNPPAFLLPTLLKLSELRVRLQSRSATAASVAADYDAGMARLLAMLDATDSTTLATSATSFRDTRTIAEMFRLPVEHMAEHAAHIRGGLVTA